MKLIAAWALVVCVGGASMAHASTSSETSQKLLGWSDDGRTWAVLATDPVEGTATIDILRDGKTVLQVCNSLDEEGSCEAGPKTVAVALEEKRGRRGLERVNIESHRGLKSHKLKRVRGAWRKAFRTSYSLRRTPYGESPGPQGGRCAKGWELSRRSDKRVVAKTKAKSGCLSSNGGYLHPNGKFALIKTTASDVDDPEEGMSDSTEISYSLVKIDSPVPSKP